MLERIGRFLSDRTPQKSRDILRNKLSVAGNPGNLTVGGFTALRDVAAVVGLILGLLIGLLVGHGFVGPVVGIAVGALIGFYAPLYWINSLTGSRRTEIQKALPDAMDLLTIAAEAGQSFDAAISNVVDKYHNALADEFAVVIRETQLGRPRLEALEDMGKRGGVEDLSNFVQSVIQSEQMGVGIARILRIQSQELRRKRRQRAQEQAAQATLKMMLPMVGCIFPTLWIILLGPAVLVILKARGG
jgi:tight adherence protein C